jgi:hypothetical protein
MFNPEYPETGKIKQARHLLWEDYTAAHPDPPTYRYIQMALNQALSYFGGVLEMILP